GWSHARRWHASESPFERRASLLSTATWPTPETVENLDPRCPHVLVRTGPATDGHASLAGNRLTSSASLPIAVACSTWRSLAGSSVSEFGTSAMTTTMLTYAWSS